MPQAGTSIISVLTKASLQWGTYRKKFTRERRAGECYLPISLRDARMYKIYNSNINPIIQGTCKHIDIPGINIFNVTSTDGLLHGMVKTQGNFKRGEIHAKNLSGNGDLCALTEWLHINNAQVGSRIHITWITTQDIELAFLC